ncbi:uncharacterized [Tachysurus ichikawai]
MHAVKSSEPAASPCIPNYTSWSSVSSCECNRFLRQTQVPKSSHWLTAVHVRALIGRAPRWRRLARTRYSTRSVSAFRKRSRIRAVL